MLDIQHNFKEAAAHFRDRAPKQVRFATALALTRIAKHVQGDLTVEMRRIFDNPTPFTLGSVFTKPATPRLLAARTWLKDEVFKGTPAARYLMPQIEGGHRSQKRSERAFDRAGWMGAQGYAMPAAGADLDQYGNMARRQTVQLLSYFRALRESKDWMSDKRRGKLAKGNAKRGARGVAYFALSRAKGGLKPGIYARTQFAFGSAIKPVLLFTRAPVYRPRFRFYAISAATIQRTAGPTFLESMREAEATAR
jgi:hypothetical protein